MNTLYLFIDESGNFDFSPNGTKFFVLTVLSTMNPFDIGSSLLKLRYDLLPNYACGTSMAEQGYFHASEDTQEVRNNVFSIISKTNHQMRVDSIIAQKNKANPTFHKQPLEFYKVMGEALLKYAFNRAVWHDFDHVVVVFSSLFDKKKRGILKQAFKSLVKHQAKSHSPYIFTIQSLTYATKPRIIFAGLFIGSGNQPTSGRMFWRNTL